MKPATDSFISAFNDNETSLKLRNDPFDQACWNGINVEIGALFGILHRTISQYPLQKEIS